jgi:hypothetical protein
VNPNPAQQPKNAEHNVHPYALVSKERMASMRAQTSLGLQMDALKSLRMLLGIARSTTGSDFGEPLLDALAAASSMALVRAHRLLMSQRKRALAACCRAERRSAGPYLRVAHWTVRASLIRA